jgi:hypothetical protein
MFHIIILCHELETHNGILLSLALILSVYILQAARANRILVLTDIRRMHDSHTKLKLKLRKKMFLLLKIAKTITWSHCMNV